MNNGTNGSNGKDQALPEYFSEPEAAKRITERYGIPISASTLFRERKRAKGSVPHFRFGARVYYTDECLQEYVQKAKRCA